MTTVDLKNLELNEFIGKDDEKQHCRATFPLVGAHGSKNLATVYFEIEPGDNLGRHTDSAEELLIVLDGQMEVEIGGEYQRIRSGQIALVPEMVPHDMVNIGDRKARVLGVFGGANNIVATFEKVWLPVNSRVVDTAQMA
jgi:quercetin dioxygenase-like cupin family protein